MAAMSVVRRSHCGASQDERAADLRSAAGGFNRRTPLKKAMIIRAIHEGRLTLGEMCARYGVSLPEFHGWEVAVVARGITGLRVSGRGRRRHCRAASAILEGVT